MAQYQDMNKLFKTVYMRVYMESI